MGPGPARASPAHINRCPLVHGCRYTIERLAANRSSSAASNASSTSTSSSSNPILAFLNSLFASERNSIAPYGVDPTFLPRSRLYEPSEVGHEEWYYGKDELGATGTPYGFFHRPMTGYADGFPVLLESNLDRSRLNNALVYLQARVEPAAPLTPLRLPTGLRPSLATGLGWSRAGHLAAWTQGSLAPGLCACRLVSESAWCPSALACCPAPSSS